MISTSGTGTPAGRELVLALDQGTTNTKAVLVEAATGRIVASGSRPVGITFPAPGSVEQDAAQLWDATVGAVADCLAAAGEARPIAVAVSNQRESVVAWSRSTGRPLGPVLGWQDARTAAACAALVRSGVGDEVARRTGLSLDPMFSAPKMAWLLESATRNGADPADICLGTIDSWLLWNLTGEHSAEAGNASRTLLLDLTTVDWHDSLLDIFGVPAAALGQVRRSDARFGTTRAAGALPAGLPVAAVLADSHAALYHHGCTTPGTGKATYGTGSSVMTPCDGPDRAPRGIATTLAWLTDRPTFAREGNIVASGSALDWMATTLGAPAGVSGGAFLSELAAEVPDSDGVFLVPAFSGLGAPYWDRRATGLLTGITGGTTRAHLARAALEAVAHQVADVVEAIEVDGRARIDVLHADGGATASAPLMQIQADLLGRAVRVADAPEASALGAALLAARSLGFAEAPSATGVPVHPTAHDDDRQARRAGWATAVARARGLPVPDSSVPEPAPAG